MESLVDYDLALPVYLDHLLNDNTDCLQPTKGQAKDNPTLSDIDHHSANNNNDSLITIPDWAVKPFTCLAFKIASTTYTVPLNRLKCAQRLALPSCYQSPDHSPWIYGFTELDGHHVNLVDIGKLVSPLSSQPSANPASTTPYDYMISIADSDWALVCHGLPRTAVVTQDDVHWRSDKSSLSWIVGHIRKFSSILLDIDGFLTWLSSKQSERLHNPLI